MANPSKVERLNGGRSRSASSGSANTRFKQDRWEPFPAAWAPCCPECSSLGFFHGNHAQVIENPEQIGKARLWVDVGGSMVKKSLFKVGLSGNLSGSMADPSFTYVSGPDDFLANRAATKLWKAMCSEVEDEFSIELIDGNAIKVEDVETLVNRFREATQTLGLFGGRRVVWLKGARLWLTIRPAGLKELRRLARTCRKSWR